MPALWGGGPTPRRVFRAGNLVQDGGDKILELERVESNCFSSIDICTRSLNSPCSGVDRQCHGCGLFKQTGGKRSRSLQLLATEKHFLSFVSDPPKGNSEQSGGFPKQVPQSGSRMITESGGLYDDFQYKCSPSGKICRFLNSFP